MLADLFGIIGQYTYQINALRLLLKLNNGFRNTKVDHISGILQKHIQFKALVILTR